MAASRSTQSAAGRRRAAASSRSRRAPGGAPRAKRGARSPGRGREIAALACAALAVYLVFVLYFGWHGGSLGGRLVLSLRVLFGVLAFVAPLVLLYAAYALAAKSERRPPGEITVGVVVLVLALALAAAADSFGVFGGTRPERLFVAAYIKSHGGVAGEGLWAGLHVVIGQIGIDVLVVAALVAGALLVSGSSLGRALRPDAGRAARRGRRAPAEDGRLAGARPDAARRARAQRHADRRRARSA